MSLLADLVAESIAIAQGPGCRVCSWLSTRPADEQAEWAQAVLDERIKTMVIARKAQKMGCPASLSTVERHRKGHLGAR